VLAGDRGRLIAETMPQPAMTTWAVVIRTCIIDDFIREAIAKVADTILNLGAGLDTRGLPGNDCVQGEPAGRGATLQTDAAKD
jgi:Leucine carboxyl methyltransferase